MRRIFLSLLIGIICINAAHAMPVHGRVILDGDNEPATRATISFYDNDHKFISGAIANDNGEFNTTPPNTAQTAKITYVGYTPQTFSVSEVQNKTVTLQPAENMLDEVTVVGKNKSTTSNRGGDGCDNEENNRISPELALCSVHAYNIGEATNPSGADRQLMKDVIALKTTVITQQMDKQYEYMDAMIRRFKTQLEKAVLTTKLQAAGAAASGNNNSGNGGGSYSSGGSYSNGGSGNVRNDGRVTNIFLSDAQNCASKLETPDLISCLKENYSLIYDATNGGQTASAEARKQLAADFKIVRNAGILDIYTESPKEASSYTMGPTKSGNVYDSKCEQDRAMSQRNRFQECLSAHSSNLRKATDKYNRENRQDKK